MPQLYKKAERKRPTPERRKFTHLCNIWQLENYFLFQFNYCHHVVTVFEILFLVIVNLFIFVGYRFV